MDLSRVREAPLRQEKAFHLHLEVGDDGTKIGISATLPDAVYGPLHLDGSAVYRGQAVGDGQFTVIVGVDAQKGMRRGVP